MQQITIVDIDGILTATQTPTPFPWILLILPVIVFVVFFRAICKQNAEIRKTFSKALIEAEGQRLLRKNKRFLFLISAVVPLVTIFFILGEDQTVRRFKIDRHDNWLEFDRLKDGVVLQHAQEPASDFVSAEMEYEKSTSHIILIRPDGGLVYPLGDSQSQNEANAYVLLTALREVVGHPAPASQ